MQGRKAMLILHGKQAMNEELRSAVHDLRDTGWALDVRVTWEAGDAQRLALQGLGRHVASDVVHDRRRARALPADHGVAQFAGRIDQRAIDAKRRHGDAGNALACAVKHGFHRRAAGCKLAKNFVDRPDMP